MPDPTASSKNHPLFAILLLVALPLLAAAVLSPFSIFFRRDALTAHYPGKKIFLEELHRGAVPYWNPSASFGQPLLADPNLEPFYPDNVAYLLLPFNTAWNFHFLFHWIFGMAGIYTLLILLGRHRQSALLGMLWWGGSGFVLSLFSFYNLIAVTAWMPWVLVFEYLVLSQEKRLYAILLGGCFGLQFLAGEPVTSLCTVLVALFFLLDLKKRPDRRLFTSALIAGLTVVPIAFPQIQALREIYAYTSRAMVPHSFWSASNASVELQRLLEWIIPYCWGPPYERAPNLFLGNRFTNFPFLIDSFHLSVALLASLFFAIKRKRLFRLSAPVVLFALALGRSAPFWKLLYQTVPRWDEIHFPIKFFSGALVFMILLGTEGFDEWRSEDQSQSRRRMLLFALIWVIGAAIYFLYARPAGAFYLWQCLIAIALFSAFLAVGLRYKSAILLFVVVEVVVGARFLYQGIPTRDLHSPDFSPGTSRTYFNNNFFPIKHGFPNINALYSAQTRAAFPTWGGPFGFRYAFDETVDGMYSFYNEYFAGFLRSLPPGQQLSLLSRLGVTQLITKQELKNPDWIKEYTDSFSVYTKKQQEPLFFPVSRVESKASPQRTLTGLAALENASFTRWKTSQTNYAMPQTFEYRSVNYSRYEIQTDTSERSFVVGRVTYFPTWRAVARLRDGSEQAVKVNQTDLSFVGFEIPANTKQVTFYYESRITKLVIVIWVCFMIPICIVIGIAAIRQLAISI